jgi:hypothetical protein
VNTRRRIASLFRELADAFDDLETEQAGRRAKRPQKSTETDDTPISPDVAQRVRRGLRRAGIRA